MTGDARKKDKIPGEKTKGARKWKGAKKKTKGNAGKTKDADKKQ
jgi:hypothetical protein